MAGVLHIAGGIILAILILAGASMLWDRIFG
jgi:hypothetical protein